MKKSIVGFVFIVIAVFAMQIFAINVFSADPGNIQAVKEKFQKVFPRMSSIDEIRESEIKGLYEIVSAGRILYYYPEKNYLIFGEIWTSEGKSLTAEKTMAMTSKKIKNLPLEKAIKIGSGKNKVIVFTDPECPYCKKAYDFFKDKDVTMYAFFVPTHGEKSEKKIRYILCSKDKEKAYNEVMSGRYEGSEKPACNDKNVQDAINEHRRLSVETGVTGVPFLIINGEPVNGFNTVRIDEILNKKEVR
jgi:thiol:disulfide interchange protein DsbC